MRFTRTLAFWGCLLLALPSAVFAHEAYVLTQAEYVGAFTDRQMSFADALYYPENVALFFAFALGVSILLIANFLFRHSAFGRRIDDGIEKAAWIAPLIIRVSLFVLFLFSGINGRFFGPELPLSAFAGGEGIRFFLIFLSGLLLVGLWTELAALLGGILYLIGLMQAGPYLLIYAPVLGACTILFLWGSRYFSLDRYLEGYAKKSDCSLMLSPVILRIFFGVTLIYSGILIKVIHPAVALAVVENYHLTELIPFVSDPLLFVFLCALIEIGIGVFVLIGFEMRLMLLVSLVMTTLSLLYFRELLWPHILLYGTALALLVSHDDKFTIDTFFDHHGLLRISKKEAAPAGVSIFPHSKQRLLRHRT